MSQNEFDVVILGAGGAGMMCAIHAGQRYRSVALVDHSKRVGGKILISGGGRCNFTNTGASPAQYVSQNPHFIKSALSRYPSEKFIEMVREHGIAFHEKKLGQLFCDESAQSIVQMLQKECNEAGVQFFMDTQIQGVHPVQGAESDARFEVTTSAGVFRAHSLVIATGGLSIPKIGATGLGYDIAKQFGLRMVSRVPALDGFTFSLADFPWFSELSGVSVDCTIEANGVRFRENLLFTHSGMSGPAALQASLHWNSGDEIEIDLVPDSDLFSWFLEKKHQGNTALVKNLLSERLPSRLAEKLCDLYFPERLPLPQVSEKALEVFCKRIHAWRLKPSGTVGYGKAEVTRGGVDTDELSSKTMEAKKIPGMYFIGEVVDVTGWLGGYNFQWAWASGWAAGQVV